MEKKSPVTPPGIDPGISQLVAQCLNHYATPGPSSSSNNNNNRYGDVHDDDDDDVE
jgi:hypothetical protein